MTAFATVAPLPIGSAAPKPASLFPSGFPAATEVDELIDSPRAMRRAKKVAAKGQKVSAKEIREYMPLVHHMVSQLLGKIPVNVLREDLLAAGAFGLVTSMLRDGPQRSPTFEWYARIRIRGAIMDELRNQDWLTRRARTRVHATFGQSMLPSERSTFVGFDDLPDGVHSLVPYQDEPPSPHDLMEAEYDRRQLAEAIETLHERERHILYMHYFRGVQFKTIAEELGVSMPRVSQLHGRAVAKLRQALRNSRAAS